jgi:hypothetical protein
MKEDQKQMCREMEERHAKATEDLENKHKEMIQCMNERHATVMDMHRSTIAALTGVRIQLVLN